MARLIPDSRRLLDTVAALDALGGIPAVAALTGCDVKNVDNWQRAETFPARYFLVMWLELISAGYTVSPSLWGQKDLPRNKEPLLMILAKKASEAA